MVGISTTDPLTLVNVGRAANIPKVGRYKETLPIYLIFTRNVSVNSLGLYRLIPSIAIPESGLYRLQ